MPKTIYEDDEIYLTEDDVNTATMGADKARMVCYLIRRLQDNGRAKYTPGVEDILSQCADELESIFI